MMRQRWGLGTVLGALGIVAALIAACSGNDIPPISNEDRDAFEEVYGDDDATGAAGSSMSGVAGAGGGGMVGSGGSGAGGAPPAGGRGGGGGAVVGGGGSGSGTPCDAPVQIFAASCAVSSTCHGAGSGVGDFAASPAAAEALVDVPSLYSPDCGLWIDSANPEESLLLTKVNDTFDKQNCGQLRMPLSGDFLEPEDEACILSWLEQFAD